MALRWSVRHDVYQRVDEQFNFKVAKRPGLGVSLMADVDWYDDDGILCSEHCFETKFFDSMSNCEMFLSRKKREYNIHVDDLISRTYYFGRQNSRYEKEN